MPLMAAQKALPFQKAALLSGSCILNLFSPLRRKTLVAAAVSASWGSSESFLLKDRRKLTKLLCRPKSIGCSPPFPSGGGGLLSQSKHCFDNLSHRCSHPRLLAQIRTGDRSEIFLPCKEWLAVISVPLFFFHQASLEGNSLPGESL